ncbi:YoaK family protein [Sphingopyxis panaciterrae]
MLRFDRSVQTLAVGTAILAGFVDAIGFIESGGFFVSFMTGNSTRLAVGAAEWQKAALVAGAIIAIFVGGVVSGSLIAAKFRRKRTVAVLAFVTLLLGFAMTLRFLDGGWPAIACLALAMGVVNAAFEGQDGAVVGVTYMTGTLVQMGHKIAHALRGEGDGRWLPHLWLWAGLVAGATIGAHITLWSPLTGYGLAALLSAALMLRAISIARIAD